MSKDWDREHFERWMDTVRSNQRDNEEYGTVAGTPYQGGVFSTAMYGSGAEFYSVTGMYENPLLERKHHGPHKGKGPKGYNRADDRIHDEICKHLTQHSLVDASLIDIHVENGVVTMTGEVTDRRMKYLAEDVVDEVTGVKEIRNKVRVSGNQAA